MRKSAFLEFRVNKRHIGGLFPKCSRPINRHCKWRRRLSLHDCAQQKLLAVAGDVIKWSNQIASRAELKERDWGASVEVIPGFYFDRHQFPVQRVIEQFFASPARTHSPTGGDLPLSPMFRKPLNVN